MLVVAHTHTQAGKKKTGYKPKQFDVWKLRVGTKIRIANDNCGCDMCQYGQVMKTQEKTIDMINIPVWEGSDKKMHFFPNVEVAGQKMLLENDCILDWSQWGFKKTKGSK